MQVITPRLLVYRSTSGSSLFPIMSNTQSGGPTLAPRFVFACLLPSQSVMVNSLANRIEEI
jgi:hypothetical protein